jgi:hypothetical protein
MRQSITQHSGFALLAPLALACVPCESAVSQTNSSSLQPCPGAEQGAYAPQALGPGFPDSMVVDDPPRLRPPPTVPGVRPDAQAITILGTVRFRLVVDTAGVAIPCSIRLVSTSDSALVAPARTILLAARFHPGRKGGRPVPTLIQEAISARAW